MTEEAEAILNIYKTDEWTAHILTDRNGFVLDVEIKFKPTSEYAQRGRHYKQKPRVELPEDLRSNADAAAWV